MTLDEIRKLIEAATPEPWTVEQLYEDAPDWYVHGPEATCVDWHYVERDARFIAAARTLLPALLEVAEKAKNHCSCVGLTYHGGHTVQCQAVSDALAAIEALKLP